MCHTALTAPGPDGGRGVGSAWLPGGPAGEVGGRRGADLVVVIEGPPAAGRGEPPGVRQDGPGYPCGLPGSFGDGGQVPHGRQVNGHVASGGEGLDDAGERVDRGAGIPGGPP